MMPHNKFNPAAIVLGSSVGAFVGVAVGEIIKKRPSVQASDSEKLDYLALLLAQILEDDALSISYLGMIVERLDTIASKLGLSGSEMPSSILTPWVMVKNPELIFEQAIRNAGVFNTAWVDFRNGKRVALRVENTLNQPVNLQAIGNFTDSLAGATNIGVPVPCPANGNISLGIWGGNWQPYIAIAITVALAPTQGDVKVWSVMQE